MAAENWMPVPGFDGMYDVSDQGRVRSWHGANKRPTPYVMRTPPNSKGYLKVTLCHGGRRRHFEVQRIVALAFFGPRPDDLQTRHLDGDSTNNAVANLAYGTASENQLDSVRHGTHPKARKTHCPAGHPYDEEHCSSRGQKGRRCLVCHRTRQRAYNARKVAA